MVHGTLSDRTRQRLLSDSDVIGTLYTCNASFAFMKMLQLVASYWVSSMWCLSRSVKASAAAAAPIIISLSLRPRTPRPATLRHALVSALFDTGVGTGDGATE